MNIIFGDSVDTLPDHYIKLEPDTFRTAVGDNTFTAYCLIEKLPIEDFANLKPYKIIHADLLKAYRQKHWHYCQQTIQALMGRWGGELDSFYCDLLKRVNVYQTTDPGPDWDGILVKEDI